MTYDQWKTTPPDWMQENDEPTPEQEAEEAFDEWLGCWVDDLADDGYVASLEVSSLPLNAEGGDK